MRRALGKSFGATHVLTGDEEGLDERIAAATLGKGADIVVDASSDTSGRVAATAIKAAAVGATLVLGGIGQVPLNIGEIRRKYLTIKPVRGHSTNAVERALTLLQRHSGIFSAMPSRSFPLSETANAIAAGNAELSPEIVRAELRPWK
jgi:threonine dehydrogenase-like Zn-dependent dehydrogenase